MLHLDTHVVIWLYEGTAARLPDAVQRRLEAEELAISPMVDLELHLLAEIGRIAEPAVVLLDDLARSVGLRVSDHPFSGVVAAARDVTWTRDPFDRLIVAQAIAEDARLLTKDQRILDHCERAGWD